VRLCAEPYGLAMRRDDRRVRSRGLPSQRRMERKWGIMTTAIRTPLVVRGAGERPTKSSLTSPVYALPACSPLWRAFVHRAYPYAKKVPVVSRCAGEGPHALAVPAASGHLTRISSGMCLRLDSWMEVRSILDLIPSCVNRTFVPSIRDSNRFNASKEKG